MERDIIVRADFYPNGTIIPLGITFNNGETLVINQIEKIEKKVTGRGVCKSSFLCIANKREIILDYCEGKWILLG